MQPERIEQLLSSGESDHILQGLFLAESLRDASLYTRLARSVPYSALLAHFFNTPLPWSSGSRLRALAQLRILQLVCEHPDLVGFQTSLESTVSIQQRGPQLFSAAQEFLLSNGRRITLARGPLHPDPLRALQGALGGPIALPLAPLPLRPLVRRLSQQLLTGPFKPDDVALRLYLIRETMKVPGPWVLSLNGYPERALPPDLPLEGVQRLRLADSKVHTLPDAGPPTLHVDARNSALLALPPWVRHATLDKDQWQRWHAQLPPLHTLAIASTEPIDLAAARLPALRALEIRAPGVDHVVSWLQADARALLSLSLHDVAWTPPAWLWSHPIGELRLTCATLPAGSLPPAPPEALRWLFIAPEQAAAFPSAWQPRMQTWAQGQRVVVLTACGPHKIRCIKLIRRLTGLGLRDAVNLIESLPQEVLTAPSALEAREIAQEFRRIDAWVELRPR